MRRLTLDYIKSLIVNTEYQRFGDTLTVCVLTLQNGFKVTGESACIHADNFDEAIGRQVAYDDAVEKIWELEGYLTLQQMLEAGISDRLLNEETKNNPKNIPSNPIITGIFITPEGHHLVMDKDYGDGFFIPLRNGRFVYAKKAEQPLLTDQIIYTANITETAECELPSQATIMDKSQTAWSFDSFLFFWQAGELVGLDVGLNGLFARQAEDFNKLKDINAC